MAKGTGRVGVGRPLAAPVVGYGAKGNAFHNVAKFNASKAGNAPKMTAQNNALKGVRRAITQTAQHPGPQPLAATGSGSAARNPTVPKMPGSYHGKTSGATPMTRVPGMK